MHKTEFLELQFLFNLAVKLSGHHSSNCKIAPLRRYILTLMTNLKMIFNCPIKWIL